MQTTSLFFLRQGNCKSGSISSSFILQPMFMKDYFMEAPFDLKIEEQTPHKCYDSWKTNTGIYLVMDSHFRPQVTKVIANFY